MFGKNKFKCKVTTSPQKKKKMQGDKKPKKIKPTILNLRKRKLTKKKKGVDVLKYNLKNKNKKLYTEFFFQKPNITLYYDPLYLFCSFFIKLIFKFFFLILLS